MNASIHRNPKFKASMLGMSLVEILAAMLVGLIGMTIIMQVYTLSEERKRTTTGTGDAQINGSIAMFTLERELRPAGFGMVTSNSNMLGCTTSAADSSRTMSFPAKMAPVTIDVGASGGPDTITVIYGSSATAVDSTTFVSSSSGGAVFPVKNAAGFMVGDLVVAQEGANCSIAEITGFAVGSVNNIEHGVAAAYSYAGTNDNGQSYTVSHTSTLNPSGGLGTFTSNAKLFSLGRNPVVKRYTIDSAAGTMMALSLFPYTAAQDSDGDGWSENEVAEGVVQLKAEYGKDTNADNIVDAWNTTTPTTDLLWQQVLAIRVALLARSGQFEKTAVTPVEPTWYGGSFTMTNAADGTDWRNYRYRVYQTVVPLRNIIWSK
ncbi:MAG TPA: PilW family protein [Burkholderiales bacterium]|nr:PilW family protein [Burkholderiales bacterium]